MLKFGRNYLLKVDDSEDNSSVTVAPPVTLEFDSTRDLFGSANNFSIRLYNITKAKRTNLRRDLFSFEGPTAPLRHVSLSAGYGTNIPEIIRGNILQCWTVREGNNYITQIEGLDAGFAFANAVTQAQYIAGTPQQTIIEDLVSSLSAQGVSMGAIGSYPGTTSRGTSYNGKTCDLLRELTGGGFTVDNGTAHVLGDNEVIDDEIIIINAQTGLLGTPMIERTIVHVDIIFDPRIKMCQRVLLQSVTEDRFDGIYKVAGIHNKGTISAAVCGSATTSLSLINGSFNPVASAVG